MENEFTFIAYYTMNTGYEKLVPRLQASLDKFCLSYEILPIKDLGSWDKNTHYKPTFILDMLKKHNNVIYVDIDAEVCEYPAHFENADYDIGVPIVDWSKYYPKKIRKEVLSGTLYFANTPRVIDLLNRWEDECLANRRSWDQRILARILPKDIHILPDEYCMIFDSMRKIERPVIKHYQASRRLKRRV